MWYNIIIPEPSIFFCMIYDYMTMTVTVICDITLTPNPKLQRKENK